MRKAYLAAVAVTVGVHFAYLMYVPSGGFLALRWPRSLWLHLPAVAWAVGVVVFRLPCPLTSLEAWARSHADLAPLPAGGFIERYGAGVVFPANTTGAAQAIAVSAAVASWAVLAAKQLAAQRQSSHEVPSAQWRR